MIGRNKPAKERAIWDGLLVAGVALVALVLYLLGQTEAAIAAAMLGVGIAKGAASAAAKVWRDSRAPAPPETPLGREDTHPFATQGDPHRSPQEAPVGTWESEDMATPAETPSSKRRQP